MTNGSAPRRRRYVSTAAGTYPPPVHPHRPLRLAADPVVDETVIPFDELEVRPRTGPVQEPDLDALTATPASPAFDDLPAGLPELPLEPRVPSFGLERMERPRRQAPSWVQQSARRMLLGGVVGALAGVLVGLVLLALRRPEGLTSLKDPVTLWRSVEDPRDWLTLGLMTFACIALGAAASARKRPSQSRED